MRLYDAPIAPNPRRVRWVMAEKGITDIEVIAWNQQGAMRALKVLDRRLGESEWIAAERLTIADIVAAIGIDFARIVRLKPPEELVHVGRWLAAMRERPGYKA